MISIGQNRKWSIQNSDVFGDLSSATGVSFDERGYIKLNGRPTSLVSSVDSTNLGLLLSVVYYGSLYWLFSSAGVYTLSNTFDVVAKSGSPFPTPSQWNDAIAFNGKIYCASDTNVYTWNGSAWTDTSLSATSGVKKCLEVVSSGPYWALGYANVVKLYDTSNALVRTLTLPAELEVTSMKYRLNALYIGTRHLNGGEAEVFVWAGTSTAYQANYGVGANKVYSVTAYGQNAVCITSAGQILKLTVSGFQELCHLPVFEQSKLLWDTNSLTLGQVLSRGMIQDGNLLYINLQGGVFNDTASNSPYGYLKSQPSGLWVYDPSVGFYCKSLHTTAKYKSPTLSSLSSSTFTISSTKTKTGDAVYIKNVGSMTGITQTRTYFIIRISDTQIKLALTQADAEAGNAITIGGTLGVGAELNMASYDALGTFIADYAGAIALVNPALPMPSAVGNVMWGSRTGSTLTSGTTYNTLNVLWNSDSQGSVISTVLSGQNVQAWENINQYAMSLLSSNDKIVIKYRTNERFGLPTSHWDQATWQGSNTISVTPVYASYNQVEVGDELVVVYGSGAGKSAKITAISTGSTYTFTLDRDIDGAASGETCLFYIDSWKIAGEFDKNSPEYVTNGFVKIIPSIPGSWLQFKIELSGTNTKLLSTTINK